MVYNNNDMFKAYVVLSLIQDQVENIYGCKKKKIKKKEKKKKKKKKKNGENHIHAGRMYPEAWVM